MCIIIYRPADKPDAFITDADLKTALDRNSDGIGVMYPIRQEGGKRKLHVEYLMGTLAEQVAFYRKHEALAQYAFAAHARLTTDGINCIANCHPHKVIDREDGHRGTVYMMHNGVINNHRTSKDAAKSDTVAFVEEVLRPLHEAYPALYRKEQMKTLVGDYIGASKLLFMDERGRSTLINENLGLERNGMWLSNDYSLTGCVANKGYANRTVNGKTERWDSAKGTWVPNITNYPTKVKTPTACTYYDGEPAFDEDFTFICDKASAHGNQVYEEYLRESDGKYYYFTMAGKYWTSSDKELFVGNEIDLTTEMDEHYIQLVREQLEGRDVSTITDLIVDDINAVVAAVFTDAQKKDKNLTKDVLADSLSENAREGAAYINSIL